jgi:hypothetical protein
VQPVTRLELGKVLYGLGKIYDKDVNEDVLSIWFNALQEVTCEELARAVTAYIKQADSKFFPKPGEIYALAKGIVNLESEAALIADLVFQAQASYGCDITGTLRAEMKMGEIGWSYVKNCGGWETFVQSVRSYDDVSNMKSQARKSIQGLLERKRSGVPDREQQKLENLEVMKKLGLKMKDMGTSEKREGSDD